jgi:hypothetical protein
MLLAGAWLHPNDFVVNLVVNHGCEELVSKPWRKFMTERAI